ncbi:MAG TPA: MazG family protein [Streptosporangiaceae bacterium]|nr:MazG family protein [Streptosporangiaceae bacterium]
MLILLVTSPRVAPGLLTRQAWDALRGAARVLAPPGHPQHAALIAAGIDVDLLHVPGEELAQRLAAAADAGSGDVVWLVGPPAHPGGADGESALRAGLEATGVPIEVLRGSVDLPGARLLDLVVTMTTLRTQCPWDAKQTHESLAPHLLEEPYEALEALENGDDRALREELGDVLLQVLFHAEVASERDDGTGYTIDDVADGIVSKLVRRHPHVFADVAVSGSDEVALNWDEIKKAERAQQASPGGEPGSALDGVPLGQPGLSLASQLQRRAHRAGLPDELLTEDNAAAGDGLGDQLFALVATARAADLDPELELRAAARRYRDRVRAWERAHPPE